MVGVPVLLRDAQPGEEVFESVPAATGSRGVNGSVVRECGRGNTVFLEVSGEIVDDIGPGDGGVDGAGEQQPGVVVEPVQDLHIGAVGESPVGEVRLPGLVGLIGLQAEIGRFGSFICPAITGQKRSLLR